MYNDFLAPKKNAKTWLYVTNTRVKNRGKKEKKNKGRKIIEVLCTCCKTLICLFMWFYYVKVDYGKACGISRKRGKPL